MRDTTDADTTNVADGYGGDFIGGDGGKENDVERGGGNKDGEATPLPPSRSPTSWAERLQANPPLTVSKGSALGDYKIKIHDTTKKYLVFIRGCQIRSAPKDC